MTSCSSPELCGSNYLFCKIIKKYTAITWCLKPAQVCIYSTEEIVYSILNLGQTGAETDKSQSEWALLVQVTASTLEFLTRTNKRICRRAFVANQAHLPKLLSFKITHSLRKIHRRPVCKTTRLAWLELRWVFESNAIRFTHWPAPRKIFRNCSAHLLSDYLHKGIFVNIIWCYRVGLSPQTKLQAPRMEIWNTMTQWSFCQFLEC